MTLYLVSPQMKIMGGGDPNESHVLATREWIKNTVPESIAIQKDNNILTLDSTGKFKLNTNYFSLPQYETGNNTIATRKFVKEGMLGIAYRHLFEIELIAQDLGLSFSAELNGGKGAYIYLEFIDKSSESLGLNKFIPRSIPFLKKGAVYPVKGSPICVRSDEDGEVYLSFPYYIVASRDPNGIQNYSARLGVGLLNLTRKTYDVNYVTVRELSSAEWKFSYIEWVDPTPIYIGLDFNPEYGN